MNEKWIAHIRTDADGAQVRQSVLDHCRNTGGYARRCLEGVGLGKTAQFAGLHHDDGKRTEKFLAYITAAAAGQDVHRGSVVHSFAGTRFVLEQFHTPSANLNEKITAELIAYAIGAHHGLFDCIDGAGNSGFQHRLNRADVDYEEAVANLPMDGGHGALFRQSVEEVSMAVSKLIPLVTTQENSSELAFYFGLLARLLLSAVIEGDRRDTWEFMSSRFPSEAPSPDWNARLQFMEEKLNRFPSDTAIAQARQQISQQCREFAKRRSGVFRLNVPTGGGKTLSSLRYALAHAAKYQKTRIIFTSPLLSILEQNAAVIRDFIGDTDMVLEHHSNVVQENQASDDLDQAELLAESWEAPVIITTLVQLLNTLFSGKTTAIRRFHSLCNSIIVIDEVQTVPSKMLSLFNLAVNFLSVVCSATVVLCSATQPCLEEIKHSIIDPIEEIVPYSEALWAPFARTRLVDTGAKKLDEIPSFAREILEKTDSLLIICNKKEEARQLSKLLSDLCCFHLSAAMCPEHRRNTLSEIQSCLGKKKVVCVSTQVMEAGVDISFDCVIRLTAGMDSVVQAAGRCNRNGESDEALPVYLLDCADENLGRLQDIQRAKNATTALLDQFRRNPGRFENQLCSHTAITDYYRRLFREMPTGHEDFCVGNGQPTLYELLSSNAPYRSRRNDENDFFLQQAFRTAGQLFQVFPADTTSVLVPYGKGRTIIEQLNSRQAETNLSYVRSLLEQAKPYLVNLYRYQLDAIEKAHGLGCNLHGNICWLEDGWYDPDIGLLTEKQGNSFLEV